MSRRKQARPRSCKRNEDGSENDDMLELDQEEEPEKDVTAPCLSMSVEESNEGCFVDPDTTVEVNGEQADQQTTDADKFHCGSCGITFTNLDQFMDHKNFDCSAVVENPDYTWDIGDGDCLAASRSDTPTSFGSLENSKSPGTSSESPVSPSTENLSPDLVPYSVGVNENNPYGCHYCEKAFSRLSFLKVHEQVHSNHMPFKCPFCERLFRHKRSRDRHVKLHTGDKKYKCRYCDSAFARSDHLKSHLRTHDNGKPFPCTVCNRGYTTSAALTSHMLTHKKVSNLQIKDYQCLQCKETFDNSKDLQSHIETHALSIKKEKSHSCLYCSELFYSAENLDLHVEDAHVNNNINKCPVCYDCFTCSEELCEHLKVHDAVNMEMDSMMSESTTAAYVSSRISTTTPGSSVYSTEQLVCPYCFQGDFDSLELIEIHMQSVHSVKPTEIYTCNYCNAPYPNLYTLHEHMRAVHQNQPCMDIKYPCSLCSQEFPSIESLVEHKKVAHGYGSAEKPLIDSVYCVQCSLAFSSPTSLQEHVFSTHQTDDNKILKNRKSWNSPIKEGIKVEKIKSNTPVCSGTASSSSDLYQEKTTCDQCNATFHNFKNFQAHMKIHLEATMTKFVCKQCKKSFPTEEQLESHSTSHFLCMATEYGCTSCRKLFGKPDELQKHLMDIHAHHLYRCSLCKEIFDSKVNIQVHFAIKHSNECKLYKCTHCQSVFRSEMEWQVHVRVSHLHMSKPYSLAIYPINTSKIISAIFNGAVNYQCLQCKETFDNSKDLQSHIETHALSIKKEKSHSCLYCSELFYSAENLDLHVEDAHVNNNINKCPVCYDCFTCSEELCEHLKVHDAVNMEMDSMMSESTTAAYVSSRISTTTPGSSVYSTEQLVCPYCFQGDFDSLELIEIHMQSVHSVKPTEIYTCNYCNAPYPNLYTLHEHMRAVHQNQPCMDIKYPCSLCSQEFPSIESLVEHKKVAHGYGSAEKPLIDSVYCVQCSLAFSSPTSLQEHVFSTHQTDDNKILKNRKSWNSPIKEGIKVEKIKSNTPVCSGTASSSSDLYQEKTTCDQCNATFHNFKNFQAHMKIHLEATMTKFVCKQCKKSFPTEEQLESHSTSHFLCMATEYGCTSCRKLFGKPDELQKHLMDIHAHHLYRCSLCKEIFDSKVNIQVHFAIKHSNECKLYKCTHCQSVFRSEMEWQVHVRVSHLHMSKPYRCLFCKESFTSEMDLQCHLTTHSKPFKCSMCDESFHVEYLLDKHLQGIHASASEESAMTSPIKIKVEKDIDVMNSQGGYGHDHSIGYSPGSTGSNVSGIWKSAEPLHTCNICDLKFSQVSMLQLHKSQDHGLVKLPSLSPRQISPKNKTPTPKSTPEPQKAPSMSSIPIVSSTVSSMATGFDKITLDCMYCSQHFKTRAELDKHMKIHINSGSQKCNICDEACPTASILAEHKLTHCKIQQGNMCTMCKVPLKSEDQFYIHSQEHGFQGTVMQCIVCRQTLASMVELQLHGKHHFQPRPSFYTCCVCLHTFESKENLISKLNSSGRNYYVCKPCYHGESSEYNCKQCSAKFTTGAQLESHLATCHKKTFQCIKCQESFGSEYEIQVHVASHVLREGNIHHCKLCNCSFESPAKLQIHLIQHTYDSSEYRCSVCCKIFGSASEIQSHALEHGLGARRYACSQCSLKFFFSAELENHTFSHNQSNSDPTEFKCHDCNRCFSSIINLTNHRQIHCDKDSSYKCSLCSEVFPNMGSLQQHFFGHHSKVELEMTKKIYKCSDCNKEFPCLSNLQGHMRIHKAGAAHHTCPVCKKVFALSRNLNIHLRSHSGEKPYECPICKKRFARKENRKAHMRSHGGIKPFVCPVCGKSFTRKCHVKDHLRVHFLQEGVSLNEQAMKDLGFQLDNEETSHSECLSNELSDTEIDGSIESPEIDDKNTDEHMSEVDVEPCN